MYTKGIRKRKKVIYRYCYRDDPNENNFLRVSPDIPRFGHSFVYFCVMFRSPQVYALPCFFLLSGGRRLKQVLYVFCSSSIVVPAAAFFIILQMLRAVLFSDRILRRTLVVFFVKTTHFGFLLPRSVLILIRH